MKKWIFWGVLGFLLVSAFSFMLQSIIGGLLVLAFISAPLVAIKVLPDLSKKWKALLIVAAVLILAIILQHPLFVYGTARSEVVTINGVANKTLEAGTEDKYMVYTDRGVFINDDCPLWLKWTSSDFHDQFLRLSRTETKVRLYYYGYRVAYLSWYPNIYKFEILEDSASGVSRTSASSVKFTLEHVPATLVISGRVIRYTKSEKETVMEFHDKTWSEVSRELDQQTYDEVVISQIHH